MQLHKCYYIWPNNVYKPGNNTANEPNTILLLQLFQCLTKPSMKWCSEAVLSSIYLTALGIHLYPLSYVVPKCGAVVFDVKLKYKWLEKLSDRK